MTRKILEGSGLHRASNQLYPLSIHAMNDVWLQTWLPGMSTAGFLPAAGAKILAMLTVNHYIYALKLMPLTHY
jgi:hypothetical protein